MKEKQSQQRKKPSILVICLTLCLFFLPTITFADSQEHHYIEKFTSINNVNEQSETATSRFSRQYSWWPFVASSSSIEGVVYRGYGIYKDKITIEVWREQGETWISVSPDIFKTAFVCSSSFSIKQGFTMYDDVKLETKSGSSQCSTIPYTLLPQVYKLTFWNFVNNPPDLAKSFTLYFNGGETLYYLYIPTTILAPDPDRDGDGYTTKNDCDDSDPRINPGSEEICGDNIDNNCNGLIDENCNPVPAYIYTYYLPYFKAGNGFWTGLGLTNRNQEVSTDFQVTVYGGSGDLLATENKTIPARGQDSFVVAAQLNNSGWMLVNSDQSMSGLAFLGNWGSPLLMADIPFLSDLSSCMIVPHIAQDSTWDTTILICNPNNETINITLKYVDKAGIEQGTKNHTIPAYGSGEYLLSTVFNDKIPLAGSIEISSSNGIAAFALYSDRKNGGTYYAGINAESCD